MFSHDHSNSFTVRLCRVALISLLLIAPPALAIKAQHEADRLLLAAQQALEQNNYREAKQHLTAAQNLKIKLPSEFYFVKGELLLNDGLPKAAQEAFENYVDRAGREGQHYQEALSLITRIQKQGHVSKASKPIAELKWSAETKKNQDYIGKLQMLYMSDSSAKALVTHINSLLQFYAYSDKRVKAASHMGDATRHQIRSSRKGEIISTHLPPESNQDTAITEERFSVYGVNPYVSYRCSNSTRSCWLLHPVNQRQWLQIVRNEEAAAELSKALGYLIRTLQKSG